MRRLPILLGLAAGLAAPLVAQETVAFKADRIILSPAKTVNEGVLVASQGRIVAVGTRLPIPSGAKVIDLTGHTIAPGLVDTWSQLSVGAEGGDTARAFTPTHRMGDALDFTERRWGFYPLVGVTSVIVAPATSQVAGGLACLVKTGKHPKVVDSAVHLGLSLAGAARNRQRPPTSLPGQIMMVRRAFAGAVRAGRDGKPILCPATDLLHKAIKGELPTGFYCGAGELHAAVSLARELKLKGWVAGTLATRRAPEILAGTGLGVVLLPAGQEDPAWRLGLPGKLAAAGVPVAFGSNLPSTSLFAIRSRAARAIRYGMNKADAFAALTLTPARLQGLDHMIGTLEQGRDADFIVLKGHPLNPGARITATFVEGKKVFGRIGKPKKEAGK